MIEQLTSADDKALVSAVKAGDASAFNSLLDRHYNAVYLVALSRLRNTDAAEELAQETFVTAFLQMETLKDESRLPAWLCGIARNLALRWLRDGSRRSAMLKKLARKHLPNMQEQSPTPLDKLATEQERNLVTAALEKLTDLEREAVLLHYVEGLTKRTLAERMGIHPSTAGRLLMRAVSSLKKHVLETLPLEVKNTVGHSNGKQKTVLLIGAVAGLDAAARAHVLAAPVTAVPAVSAGLLATLKIPAAVVLLGLAGWVAGPAIVRSVYIMTLPEQQKEDLHQFENKPISFPAEWAQPDLPSWQGKLSLDNVLSTSSLGLLKNPPPSELNDDTRRDIIAALTALEAVVVKPDYSLTAWSKDAPQVSGLMQALPRWSDLATTAGDYTLAMDLALMPVKLAQRPPNCNLITHLLAVGHINKGIMQVARVADQTTNTAVWQQAHDSLSALKPHVIHNYILKYGEMLDVLAPLRDYQAMGIPVDMTPGHPMAYYYKQVLEKRKEYLEKYLALQTPGTQNYKQLERDLEVARKQTDLTNTMAWQLGRVAKPNIQEAATRELVVNARYDLAQILLEQKLAGDSAEFPGSMATQFADPFTSAPYQRDSTTQTYYSIGPDERDNRRTLSYDATNGTFSAGDIWMP